MSAHGVRRARGHRTATRTATRTVAGAPFGVPMEGPTGDIYGTISRARHQMRPRSGALERSTDVYRAQGRVAAGTSDTTGAADTPTTGTAETATATDCTPPGGRR